MPVFCPLYQAGNIIVIYILLAGEKDMTGDHNGHQYINKQYNLHDNSSLEHLIQYLWLVGRLPLYSGTSRFIECHDAIYTEDYTKIVLYSGCAKPLFSLRFSCGLETANGRIKEEQFNVVLRTKQQEDSA